jgi:aryl-alcohol dehydrogenase-like predicted oxidoreductase
MEIRRMGTDGPEVSVVGLGCNNFGMRIDEAESAAVVNAALDAGITHFDTAEMYGGGKSEEFLGRALGSHRSEVVVATKALPRSRDDAYTPGALARRIREGCEISLTRLGTDYIDLYYQHYPDDDAPPDEALEALDALVTSGKARHIACSNYSPAQLETAARLSDERGLAHFCANQMEWSLINREVEAEGVPTARRLGMAIVPYFPLASGLLTGKYRAGEEFPAGSRLASGPYFAKIASDENFAYVEKLTAFAEARGHSILELAMAWLAAQDGVPSVIAGATSPEQVRANAAAAAWTLSADDLASLPTPD